MEQTPDRNDIPGDNLAEHEKELYAGDIKQIAAIISQLMYSHPESIDNFGNDKSLDIKFSTDESAQFVLFEEGVDEVGTVRISESNMFSLRRKYNLDSKIYKQTWTVAGDGKSVSYEKKEIDARGNHQGAEVRPYGAATTEEVTEMRILMERIQNAVELGE